MYVQDDYKPVPKLTLNYGLRYDLQIFQNNPYGEDSLFVPSVGKVVVFAERVPSLYHPGVQTRHGSGAVGRSAGEPVRLSRPGKDECRSTLRLRLPDPTEHGGAWRGRPLLQSAAFLLHRWRLRNVAVCKLGELLATRRLSPFHHHECALRGYREHSVLTRPPSRSTPRPHRTRNSTTWLSSISCRKASTSASAMSASVPSIRTTSAVPGNTRAGHQSSTACARRGTESPSVSALFDYLPELRADLPYHGKLATGWSAQTVQSRFHDQRRIPVDQGVGRRKLREPGKHWRLIRQHLQPHAADPRGELRLRIAGW